MSKILIADDSKTVVKILKDVISSKEFGLIVDVSDIIIAHDGLEAFNLLAMHSDIEYIFSDINMPNINGDELVEILADTEKLGDIKVVFVTSTEKVLTYHDNPAILGTITKPLTKVKIIDSFKKLLKRYDEFKNKAINTSIKVDTTTAINKLLKLADRYINKLANNINYNKEYFSTLLKGYIGDDGIYENELVEIFLVATYDYCADQAIDVDIDKEMVEFIFEQDENEIKFLEASQEYVFFKEPQEIELVDNDEEVIKYLNSTRVLVPDVGTKEMLKQSFPAILKDVKGENNSLKPKVKRYDYIRTVDYVFSYIKMLQDIDFTLITSAIREMMAKLKLFAYYYEEIKKMSAGWSNEDYFVRIFTKKQKHYLEAKEYFDKYIKLPKDISDETKLGKYQEMLEGFEKKYKKEFSDLMKQFLKQYEQKCYLIAGYYIYNLFIDVTQDAKKSKRVKEFYISNHLKGELGPVAFLPYYVKYYRPTQEEKSVLILAGKYLRIKNKREIVVVSEQANDVIRIKKIIEKINQDWDVIGYNNAKLIDDYFNRKIPDYLIIDYHFMVTSDQRLISIIESRYPKVQKSAKIVAMFEKLNSNLIQKDILDKNYSYIKKPISANVLGDFLIFN